MTSTKLLTVSLDDEIGRFLNTQGVVQLELWDQNTLLEQGINSALQSLALDEQGYGVSCLRFKSPDFGQLDACIQHVFKQNGVITEHGQMVCEHFTLFCLQVFMRLKLHRHLVTHRPHSSYGSLVFHRHHLGMVYLARFSHLYS